MNYMIIDVNTGEVVFEGDYRTAHEYIVSNGLPVVPHKRLYENYGFTDNDESNIWVIVK